MSRERKPIVENDIVRRIISTMKIRGVRQKDLMENIGVASQVFSAWKYDNGTSYMNYIDKTANYLNVTPEYLIHGNPLESDIEYTSEDKELIESFHKLSKRDRRLVFQIIHTIENG